MEPQTTGSGHYAGFWIRVLAVIIDGILLNIAFAIIGPFSPVHFYTYGMDAHHMYMMHYNWPSFGLSWLYFAIMESSVWQGTVGKHLVGIKVTDYNGMRISFLHATGRYFAKIISVITIFIGFIMVAFTAKKQGLHDMIAKTLVVRR